MGWFKRKSEPSMIKETVPEFRTYVSLSTNKRVIRNLDEVVSARRRFDTWDRRDKRFTRWGFEENQFICDMTPEKKKEMISGDFNTLLIIFSITSAAFVSILAILLSSSFGGIDGLILSFIISGAIIGPISLGIVKTFKREKEKLKVKMNSEEDPNWVATLNEKGILLEYDDGRTVWENEVYYDEIERVELDGDQYLMNKGIKPPRRAPWRSLHLARSPGEVRGGFYPIKTPAEQLVVLELKNDIAINGFEKPSTFNIYSPFPHVEKTTDKFVISIRADDKERFRKLVEEKMRTSSR